ncbi:MAG: hypothetical protein JWN69_181, partial [Alphaproteobacteria bacterium]|nr:hypothetical protein [Alphaproteobacteria bacterium]
CHGTKAELKAGATEMNSKLIKFAASSVVLGIAMVGCKPAADAYRPASASSKEQRTNKHALKQYQQAELAFRKADLPAAIEAMEKAVLYSPLDAGFRMGLAELYMKSGRFVSAEATFRDVLALNPANGRAAMALALAQVAQGKSYAAQAQLAKAERLVAPADVGLGYALAGNPQRAIEILEPAARAPDADSRLRQNLALAYAFAGDWKKARVIAAQDVSPAQIEGRMAQWAALADPSAPGKRIASLLGVTPVNDKGQPTRLALSPVPDWEAALVQAGAPAPLAPPAPVAEPAMVAAPVAPVVQSAAVETPVAPTPIIPSLPEASAPEASAPEAIIEQAVVTTEEERSYVRAAQELVAPAVADQTSVARITSTPIPAFVPAIGRKRVFAARPHRSGGYVVQIGAFSSAAQVERAWAQTQRRHAFGGSYEPLSTTVRITGKGVLHRLSIAGFDSRNTASRTCEMIKARNGVCFVRAVAGDAPVQWASRYTRKA